MLSFFFVNLHYALAQSSLACGNACSQYGIGNSVCDTKCMNLGCNYDSPVYSDDKYTTFLASDCFSSCPCSKDKLTNSVCDPECDIAECGFDLGVCGYCSSGCLYEDLLLNFCNGKCYSFDCWDFEINKCKNYCAEGCSVYNMDTYPCIEACKNPNCMLFPHNKCTYDWCSYMCFRSNIGDGVCHPMCLNADCNYDNGDCDCSLGCNDTFGECLTNETYSDPCDTASCSYKDGKCGYCASGCYKQNLGDGICQPQCSFESCNYDEGDCGCAPGCSFKYDPLYSTYIDTGFSDPCRFECLVLDCRFGADFCPLDFFVKLAVLHFLAHKNKDKIFDLEGCYCSQNDFYYYLMGYDSCIETSLCNSKNCLYCFGQAQKNFDNCLKQSFDECLVCETTMIQGSCYGNLNECPLGYESIFFLNYIFLTNQWCLKEAVYYSSSNYKEIYVNSSFTTDGNGTTENTVSSLYEALINVYASYTKIYLLNKQIDFFVDSSSSVFVSYIYDPLNITTLYEIYELWIIGNYSETEKTIVFWKDNLKITPISQRFYLKNIEFIGKYTLNKTCEYETCFYCPLVSYKDGEYYDDNGNVIEYYKYMHEYSKNCSSYGTVDVFNFKNEVFIENVNFAEFRYQFNSFIKTSGLLNLKNVKFSKMQAKHDGSIILFECNKDCIETSFIYNQGIVIDIGDGYHDSKNVTTGSFFIGSNIGSISIVNVKFEFNFLFNNLRSSIKSYLLYSKNHLGTILIEDCVFANNFVNYLIYIDISTLVYNDYRMNRGESISYSQQHFWMNNNEIIYDYCSSGMIYYTMSSIIHNIKITNLTVENSIIGKDGALRFVNEGTLTEGDINGLFRSDTLEIGNLFVWIRPRLLFLDTIIFKNSNIGKNTLHIDQFPNIKLKNIMIDKISDGSNYRIWNIISLFKKNDPTRYFREINLDYEFPYINCSESILIINSVNLESDNVSISNIICDSNNSTLGLSLTKLTESAVINKLKLENLSGSTTSGVALSIADSNKSNFTDLTIYNIENQRDSIVKFDNCKFINIDSLQIKDVKSKYFSAFLVTYTNSFNLSNFTFYNVSTEYNDGGCIFLQTGNENSLFKLTSGIFNKCISSNGRGGGLFLDSVSKVPLTSFQLNDIKIIDSSSDEGSAIFITNYIIFSEEVEESKLKNIMINNSKCTIGGIFSDYHFNGTLEIDGLVIDNSTRGIYVSYTNPYASLRIYNTIINASKILNSVVYLTSIVNRPIAYFQNLKIYSAKENYALEAYNFKISIEEMTIFDSYQAFYMNNQVKLDAYRLVITNTKSKIINSSKNCSFYCEECEFYNNNGPIIESSTYSNFSLVNSKVFSNNLKSENLILISLADDLISFVTNTTINSNALTSGSLFYLTSSVLIIKDCFIIDNNGSSNKIQAIYLSDSTLSIYSSKLQFNSLVLKGALIYAESGSYVLAEDSTFEKSLSTNGNIYGSDITMKIHNCSFSGNSGGDLYLEQSTLIMTDSSIKNSILTGSNTGVIGLKSNLKIIIEKTKFWNISARPDLKNLAYVYNEFSYQLEITSSYMIGSEDFIMAVYNKESDYIIIKNSSFTKFKTEDYSALTMISNVRGFETRIIDSKITENLSTKNGGGIYSNSYDIIIENCEISFNFAQDSGGGVYYKTPSCNTCEILLLGNTKIYNNSCNGDGGAIKWEDYKPYIENKELIYNNSALYGADFASKPAKFGLFQSRQLSDNIIMTLLNVSPGKRFNETFQIYIYDTYGQIVETENSIIATLLVNETLDRFIAISGITTFKAKNGVLHISDFILTGVPGSSAYIKLISDNMTSTSARNDENEYLDSAYIKVDFRNCISGEQIQASACIDCPKGKYELKASENCLDCPTGATCPGGNIIIVKNGYWRSSLESDVIYPCKVFDACIKGTGDNELGSCSTGYSGVLCQSCELGYSKITNSICTKCPNDKTNFATIVLLCLSLILISFVLVKTTLTSAFSPKALHSIYIKIFTNYLQLIFIVTQFDLEWPPYIIEFFKIQRSTASISDQLFSFDCYISLKDSGDIENIYYIKLCIITSLPIVITFLSYLYWILFSFIKESYKCLKREVFTTIIVLFFLVYPTIVKFMFSNFSCIDIDKMSSYLNDNTGIECWNSNHKKFSFIIAIPSIILWVIGIPTILLLLMTKNKRRLHLDYYRVVYGFLYNGYKQSRYYWEINIMYRKILLITITVFKISQSNVLQALNFIIVIIASIYIHSSYRPYNSSQLNSMEMQALNIAGISIYFGLYYLSKSIGQAIQILLFIVILLGNSYFIAYWIYFMTQALIDIFIKYFPQFRSFFKRGDAFEEDFNKEEIARQGIYFNPLEGKKAYTFLNIENQDEDETFKYKNIEEVFKDVAKRDIDRFTLIK